MNQSIEIPPSLDGERLDRVLALIFDRSRSEVAELIGSGSVSIGNTAITTRHHKVSTGQIVLVDLDASDTKVSLPMADSTVLFEVVHEDRDIIVVNKPAGLVVHPGAGNSEGTLVSGLLSRYPELSGLVDEALENTIRPGIVHRLDKDTSGLLVVARTAKAFVDLQGQLQSHLMGREYRALARGLVEADRGVIDAPIGRSTRHPTKMTVHASGRDARTSYEVEHRYVVPTQCTELLVTLETGRTHQIRVHLRAIGHPVAGDVRYGGSLPLAGLNRPFLHASTLRLRHPRTGEIMTFHSALPKDLEAIRDQLS